jgi:hypothetical protein
MRKHLNSRNFVERVGYIPLFNVSMNLLSKVSTFPCWAKEICEKRDRKMSIFFRASHMPEKVPLLLLAEETT